jgi:hypothetical protein
VKIVYTNLSEDDYGVKRNVKQLHLDFDRTNDKKDVSEERRLRKDARRGRLALVPSTLDNSYEEGRERAGLKKKEEFLYKTVESVRSPGPRTVAGYYISKFVKSQSLGRQNTQKGTLINITV